MEKIKKLYNSSIRTHSYITTPDGTRLSCVLFIPAKDGKKTEEPLPVILSYTAYECLHYETETDGTRKITVRTDFDINTLTDYGYVIAVVQVRGCGASFGTRMVVASRQEAADGAFAVDYLASRPFCDGNVMTAGQSYNGQTQLGILSKKPKHIKAAYIGKTDLNRYDGWVRNGIPRAFGSRPDIDWGDTKEEQEAVLERLARETVPVDDDPEGILLRQALREHMKNAGQVTAQRDYNWRDSECPYLSGSFWDALSASTYLEDINASGAAVYLDGGVLDVFRRDTILLYHNLTLRKKLIIGPWDHIRKKENPEPRFEILRFADHVLKGIQNGIMEEDPLTIRVMEYDFKNHSYSGPKTGCYRSEKEWPLNSGRRDTLYFGSEKKSGILPYEVYSAGAAEPQKGGIRYPVHYGISSGVETDNLLLDKEKGACSLGMNFMTELYGEDREYIGHPFADITFEVLEEGNSPGPLDVDMFIMLSDYDPQTGEAFQFCSGWMRSSLRTPKGVPSYNFLGLPWHDCKKGDNEYLAKGGKYSLNIDLLPVFYRIKKGHRLLATLTCSLGRTYYAGRAAYEENPDTIPPVISFSIGGDTPCRLILPDIYEN